MKWQFLKSENFLEKLFKMLSFNLQKIMIPLMCFLACSRLFQNTVETHSVLLCTTEFVCGLYYRLLVLFGMFWKACNAMIVERHDCLLNVFWYLDSCTLLRTFCWLNKFTQRKLVCIFSSSLQEKIQHYFYRKKWQHFETPPNKHYHSIGTAVMNCCQFTMTFYPNFSKCDTWYHLI